jgi:hypothetical protein
MKEAEFTSYNPKCEKERRKIGNLKNHVAPVCDF